MEREKQLIRSETGCNSTLRVEESVVLKDLMNTCRFSGTDWATALRIDDLSKLLRTYETNLNPGSCVFILETLGKAVVVLVGNNRQLCN